MQETCSADVNNNLNPQNMPFFLNPEGKNYLWGGNRLKDEYGKDIDMYPLAETWECSTHEDGPSHITTGVFKGKLLTDVLKKHPEFLGSHPKSNCELPILIKLIDAKRNLSVQVHPTDAYAQEHENGQLGKTEFWYVLDAEKDAQLVYGLKTDMTPENIKKSIENGTIEKYLQKISVKRNDLFYIEAGTIHAIGAGTLIAEIQESSNLTYRLYDYNRIDKNGQMRSLHIDKALAVANLNHTDAPKQPMRVLQYKPGCAMEFLCRCKYFEVSRMLINTELARDLVKYKTDNLSFHVLLCISGCGSISFKEFGIGSQHTLNFFKGDCIFIPANSVEIAIHGNAQFLDVRG